MTKVELLSLLSLFKEARESLALRTSNEDPELFSRFFEFEDNKEMINLVIEKEYILWVDRHFKLFDSNGSIKNSDESKLKFKEMLVKLIEQRLLRNTKEDNLANKEFCISLLNEKREVLDNFLHLSVKSEQNYKRLLYSHQRDKVLFEREFNRLIKD